MIVSRILYHWEDLPMIQVLGMQRDRCIGDVSYHKNVAIVIVEGGLNLKVSEMSKGMQCPSKKGVISLVKK